MVSLASTLDYLGNPAKIIQHGVGILLRQGGLPFGALITTTFEYLRNRLGGRAKLIGVGIVIDGEKAWWSSISPLLLLPDSFLITAVAVTELGLLIRDPAKLTKLVHENVSQLVTLGHFDRVHRRLGNHDDGWRLQCALLVAQVNCGRALVDEIRLMELVMCPWRFVDGAFQVDMSHLHSRNFVLLHEHMKVGFTRLILSIGFCFGQKSDDWYRWIVHSGILAGRFVRGIAPQTCSV